MMTEKTRQRIERLSPKQRELLSQQVGALSRKDNFHSEKTKDGQSAGILVAYIVGNDALNQSDVKEYAAERLPDYMIPTVVVQVPQLPRLPNGKVDRRSLPAPQDAGFIPESDFTAPSTPVEIQLAKIWADILDFHPVGIHDNFFEIGGDSILSIQIISRARKAGLTLQPNQIFSHQTIAKLAPLAQLETKQSATTAVSGSVPLIPIQHWFFEEHQASPHQWNQGVSFETSEKLSAEILSEAVQLLVLHHDALRLKFTYEKSKWNSLIPEQVHIDTFQKVDLTAMSPGAQDDAIREMSALTQTSFNLSIGPLFQCLFFECEAVQSNRMIMIAHHLLVDGVSWQILLDDFNMICTQLVLGELINLSAKTTSYQTWSNLLAERAKSGYFDTEYDYWQQQIMTDFVIPTDTVAKFPIHETSIDIKDFSLDEDSTQILRKEALQAYNCHIEELLITALIQSVCDWANISKLCLGIEGHGREQLNNEMDLSGSVGWFTTFFPLTFELEKPLDSGMFIKYVKERMRSIPSKGIGYGVLRYLGENTEHAEALKQQPALIFNYLGNKSQLNSDMLINPHMIDYGTRSPQSERYHILEINAYISEKQLHTKWSYSRNLHKASTVENLINKYNKALQDIIIHCASVQTGGYTPSDFPDVQLSQKDLDHLINRLDS